MTNTEIYDKNPEKELIIDKSISDDITKQISKKNTTQNKKISPKNDKSTKSFDEISNEIFRDLVSKKEEPVIISPLFQLPIILIVLSFMLLFLNIGSLPTIVFASFSFFLLLQSFTLRIKVTNDDFIVLQLG